MGIAKPNLIKGEEGTMFGLVPNVKWKIERTEGGVRGNCWRFWLDEGMAEAGWKMLSI